MATYSTVCHTCNTKAAFEVMSQAKCGALNYRSDFDGYLIFLQCPACSSGLNLDVLARANPGNLRELHGSIQDMDYLEVMRVYPEPKPVEAPEHLPDNIRKFYLQSAEGLKRGDWDSCAMMARRVLEVACKTIDPGASGKLYNRIDDLANNHLITPDLKEWAHEIRMDGNDAAHEEEPVEKAFAAELLAFTELFLTYTFTMPEMIRIKRQNKANNQNAAP